MRAGRSGRAGGRLAATPPSRRQQGERAGERRARISSATAPRTRLRTTRRRRLLEMSHPGRADRSNAGPSHGSRSNGSGSRSSSPSSDSSFTVPFSRIGGRTPAIPGARDGGSKPPNARPVMIQRFAVALVLASPSSACKENDTAAGAGRSDRSSSKAGRRQGPRRADRPERRRLGADASPARSLRDRAHRVHQRHRARSHRGRVATSSCWTATRTVIRARTAARRCSPASAIR